MLVVSPLGPLSSVRVDNDCKELEVIFNTRIPNPLWMIYGPVTFGYLLAAVAFTVAVALLWKGRRRQAFLASLGSLGMLIISADLTRVQNTDSITVYVQSDNMIEGDRLMFIYAHPNQVTVLLSMFFVGSLGYLAYRAILARKLMTMASLFVGVFAAASVAADMIRESFDYGSVAYDGAETVLNAVWDLLAISLVAYIGLAAVVFITRGIARIRHRAEMGVMTSVHATESSMR